MLTVASTAASIATAATSVAAATPTIPAATAAEPATAASTTAASAATASGCVWAVPGPVPGLAAFVTVSAGTAAAGGASAPEATATPSKAPTAASAAVSAAASHGGWDSVRAIPCPMTCSSIKVPCDKVQVCCICHVCARMSSNPLVTRARSAQRLPCAIHLKTDILDCVPTPFIVSGLRVCIAGFYLPLADTARHSWMHASQRCSCHTELDRRRTSTRKAPVW